MTAVGGGTPAGSPAVAQKRSDGVARFGALGTSPRARGLFLDALILAALIYLLYFWRLGSGVITLWDEARLANNAVEMFGRGNWLVTYYAGEPDLWNTKPPLLIWAMSWFLGVVRSPELAIRLPSAISAALTTLVVYTFCSLWLRDRFAGLCAALVLGTIRGFVVSHAARAGEYDVPLSLWTTVYCLAFFLYVNDARRRVLWLYLFALGLAAAILTKSVAALLFLPFLAVYVVWRGSIPRLLASPHSYIAALIAFGVPALFYLAREQAGPGYIAAALANDVSGRFAQTSEGNEGPFWFYLARAMRFFKPWYWAWPPLVFFAFRGGNAAVRETCRFLLLAGCGHLLVISITKTKLFWYAVPEYPLFAIVLGLGFAGLARAASDCLPRRFAPVARPAIVLFLVVTVLATVNEHLGQVRGAAKHPAYAVVKFLREIRDAEHRPRDFTIVREGHPNGQGDQYYVAPEQFYASYWRVAFGGEVRIQPPAKALAAGETVIFCGDEIGRELRAGYRLETAFQRDTCSLTKVLGPAS